MFDSLRLFCVRFVCNVMDNGYAKIKILRLSLDDNSPVISFEGDHQRKLLSNSSQVCHYKDLGNINISLQTIYETINNYER